jgi:hypothetical protein
MLTSVSQPEVLYALMAWVSTLALLFVIGATVYMVRRQFKNYRETKTRLGAVFVWIAATFVFVSVLFNTTAGSIATAFIGDTFGLGSIKPITLAFDMLIVGVVFMVSAGIVAMLMHEPKAKLDHKSQQGEDQDVGTNIFSSLGH